MSSGWLPSREPGGGGWTWAPGPVHFLSADGKAHREHREKLELVASFSFFGRGDPRAPEPPATILS